MRVAQFHEKGVMKISQVPIREISDKEVLIRIAYCGICGTDVSIYNGDAGSVEVESPRTLGHEFSGTIAAIGKKVTHLKEGDRVSSDVNFSCGHCQFCAKGNYHLCYNMQGIGTSIDGAFAEYIVVPGDRTFKIPDSIDLKHAAMIEPISCCMHGIEIANIKLGDTVMVVGCGSIGQIMIQMARHAGAGQVIAVEPLPHRRSLAMQMGATLAIDPLVEDTVTVLANYGIENIDVVIEAAGMISTVEYGLRHAGKGATVLLFGLTPVDAELTIKPFEIFKKELHITSSFVNPHTFKGAISLLEAGVIDVSKIITDVYSLNAIQEVFQNKLYRDRGKILIQP